MKIRTEHGDIEMTGDVFSTISGHAAMGCYGVKGMAARSVADGIVGLLKKEHISRGVKVTYFPEAGEVGLALHIVVEYGVNIPAACRSIMSEVRYILEKSTGIRVRTVSIYVDAIAAHR